MTSLIKSIINENVHDKIVFIRADLNIPMSNGKVLDYTRVERLIPTINFLKLSGAKIVICSHLGRPKGKYNKEFTLKPLVEILSKITFSAARPPRAAHISSSICSVRTICLSSGKYHAAPNDCPRGTIVTFTNGAACSNNQLTSACPAS